MAAMMLMPIILIISDLQFLALIFISSSDHFSIVLSSFVPHHPCNSANVASCRTIKINMTDLQVFVFMRTKQLCVYIVLLIVNHPLISSGIVLV